MCLTYLYVDVLRSLLLVSFNLQLIKMMVLIRITSTDVLILSFYIMSTLGIRFCEPAYAFIPYVSETMNALSSLCYLIVGGFYLLRQSKTDLHYNNHLVIGHSLCAIGVGSTMFHAYPTFVTELRPQFLKDGD